MKYFTFLLFSYCLLSGCSKTDKPAVLTACMTQLIEDKKADGFIEILEFQHKSGNYYLFNSGCCDRFDEFYDANCEYICAPTGGISGGGDGLCSEEILLIIEETTPINIWKIE